MLQENKLLSVQDTIDKYIPDYPNGSEIKISNLLTHTSGITDYFALVYSVKNRSPTYTPRELIELFRNKPLRFAVGICSTVEDLYKWNTALHAEKLIKKESLNEMFTPYLNYYGYGWAMDEIVRGVLKILAVENQPSEVNMHIK